MSRTVDLERKPALLDQILDYLLDKPLSEMTFRTLARGIGVSTYSLVYHFGTREELMRDIVGAISARARTIENRLTSTEATVATYLEGLELSWEWAVEPRNRQLQRLEFEAGLLEAVGDGGGGIVRALFDHWQSIGRDALVGFGLTPEDAEVESRLIVGIFHGIQYDLVLNDDAGAATRAFRRALAQHAAAITALIPAR
jgi:AcrR family transcriptional regulator